MKQILTLRNLIKLGALLFAIAAFCMMFGNQLTAYLGNTKIGEIKFDDALFGDHGSVLSFVGYLLMLIAGIVAGLLVFLKAPDNIKKYIALGVAVVLIIGAIFVFVEGAVVQNANKGYLNYKYQLTVFPILGGIFGIVAGLAVAASEFVPDKEFAK